MVISVVKYFSFCLGRISIFVHLNWWKWSRWYSGIMHNVVRVYLFLLSYAVQNGDVDKKYRVQGFQIISKELQRTATRDGAFIV